MKISFNWLKEFIELPESVEEVGKILTGTGLEVEGIEEFYTVPGGLQGLIVGEVLTCTKHPNADKLKVTTVDLGGSEPRQIICGAPNVAEGQKVIVAPVGTKLFPAGGDPFDIKKAKIRGEVSEGMICALDEIGLGEDHSGIIVLDTDLPNGAPAAQYFNIEKDYVIEIGLTPNRADAASHFGVARDLKAAFRRPVMEPDISGFKVDNHDLPMEVIVEDPAGSPRYSAVTIKDVKVTESPKWLKTRLESIGLAPINNVVDLTNYVLHSVGQPLHAFDADEVTGGKVIVKTMPTGSTFVTLDEKERKLHEEDLMICNTESGMCIGGVFGGIKSGVKETTKNIFLEAAYFSPDYIRKTASRHGLKTDASFRFERGTDPNGTVDALKWAALLIKEVAGGTISSEIIDIGQQSFPPFTPGVKYKNIDRLIGKAIPHDRIKQILNDLDIKLEDETEAGFTAVVPAYRVDVQREADVIEEILRIYGYDNVEITDHNSAESLPGFPETDPDRIFERIGELLSANGWFEIITNSLTKPIYADQIPSLNPDHNVVIFNRLSEDLSVMRQSLLPGALEVVTHNVNRKFQNIKCYELGKTYQRINGQDEEQVRLSLLITGSDHEESWRSEPRGVDFYDLADLVYRLLERLNIADYSARPFSNEVYDYGLTLADKNGPIGQMGKVNRKISSLAGVKQPVFYADLDWEKLLSLTHRKVSYRAVPKFPAVRRDLSLVLDKSIQFDQLEEVARNAERKLLKKMNVFSVYEGKNIEENKKAYAISFILQDETATLADKNIDKAMNRLIQAFKRETGATIRGEKS